MSIAPAHTICTLDLVDTRVSESIRPEGQDMHSSLAHIPSE